MQELLSFPFQLVDNSAFRSRHMRHLSLLFFCLYATVLVGQAARSQHLTRADFEQLGFSSYVPNAGEVAAHTDARDIAEVLVAAENGIERLRTYHEPIVTRGAAGVALFRTASPAVVVVTVGKINSQGEYDIEGLGSGALVDARGYVLTNWHVVNGYSYAGIMTKPTNADDPKTSEVFVGSVVALDPARDLALIRIQKPSHVFPYLQLGQLGNVAVAEDVHIIGHPKGELWSYSTGVVSQVRPAFEWSYDDNSQHIARVLQLQTAINPGNSGGPVLDDSGHLIGLIAMSTSGQNLDYAVAIDEIRRFLNQNLPARVRGAGPPTIRSVDNVRYSKASMAGGRTVTRALAGHVASYLITDTSSSAREMIVTVGNNIVRSKPGARWFYLERDSSLHGEINDRGELEVLR